MDFNQITQQSVRRLYELTALRSAIEMEFEKVQRDMERIKMIQQDYQLPLTPVVQQLNDLLVQKQNQMHELDMQIKMFALACDYAEKVMQAYAQYGVKLGSVVFPNVAVRSRILVEFRE